ncbi:hypothetical protein [Sphingomonas ursincola]|jgi:hypothetical protein|uniref:hypothetical protein n=1 Tax=Sphingomonas ursincola TaxID=56361 RepID=UPI002356C80D|nr:hypothetical protein [Sphingomonas ursincola]MBY0620599.1 hypothetical protein [Sphingomonas ursincola]
MRSFGIFLIVAGMIIVAIGFYLETSIEIESSFSAIDGYTPPSSVVNISKLQNQELIVIAGLFTALAGVILASVGELINRLENSGVIQPVAAQQPFAHAEREGQACAWCDQTVHMPNLPCSNANRDHLASKYPSMNNRKCRAAIESQGLV